ncbi:MAG: UDP-N-acetylglucosamine 2-epimerase (non-hydrolyzing) [Candidatus Palauibacterales bacterium]|nr:UDP-N-acetylglucosamine 2-epimerase (non-hydrolyzing) [Candidatus Palauibacterales bacterium]MDP2582453.1 UDP-N-acetylglucosamine 2-epimerase (non-hydrolyzing) [Candidatus Palauibacterales bacterium]
MSVVGARPQFIKMAVVDRALAQEQTLEHVIVHTGQHYDDNMSRTFFTELEISAPDANLEVGSGSHGAQTAAMLERLEAFFEKADPALVLVYGDTNSTLAGALAAVKLHLTVAHVESGLRSFNRAMPEEINRVVTDHLSDVLFAPTETAVRNLRAEGLKDRVVHRVGDVMYDAALFYADKARDSSRVLERLDLEAGGYMLATVHRAENTDRTERLVSIMEDLGRVAATLSVVVPLHPRTRVACEQAGLDPSAMGLTVIEPLGYLDMVQLERNARVIARDSGGGLPPENWTR